MSRGKIWLITTMPLIASGVPASAESPFAAELAGFFYRDHEDPPFLDVIRAGLEEAVKTDPALSGVERLALVRGRTRRIRVVRAELAKTACLPPKGLRQEGS
jgi:hypothetical protein